jgi:tRNA_anti-like
MNNKLKTFLTILVIGLITGALVYKFYIQKPVADLTATKCDMSLSASEIVAHLSDADTSALNKYNNKILSVSGIVLAIANDSSSTSITLGADSVNTNTIICQGDARHNTEFAKLKTNDNVKIKGNCTGANIDELGLGSTLQMKDCVIETK